MIPRVSLFAMKKRLAVLGGLRGKVALAVALPVFLTLTFVSLSHYQREREALLAQLNATAIHLGEVMRGSLRHAMLQRDVDQMQMMLEDIGAQQEVLRVGVFNENEQLILSSEPDAFPAGLTQTSEGCIECHSQPDLQDKNSLVLPLDNGMILRTSVAIPNEPECYECHDSARRILLTLPLRVVSVYFKLPVLSF
jgi:hypothetical protein